MYKSGWYDDCLHPFRSQHITRCNNCFLAEKEPFGDLFVKALDDEVIQRNSQKAFFY